MRLGALDIPVSPSGEVLLNWPAGGEKAFPQYSFLDVVRGDVPNEAFQGKAVLVAGTASGLDDRDFPFAVEAPGVLIYATFLDNAFRFDFVRGTRLGVAPRVGALPGGLRPRRVAHAPALDAPVAGRHTPARADPAGRGGVPVRAEGRLAPGRLSLPRAPRAGGGPGRAAADRERAGDARRRRREGREPEAARPELPGKGHARHGARDVREAAPDGRHEARLRPPRARLREPRPARQGLSSSTRRCSTSIPASRTWPTAWSASARPGPGSSLFGAPTGQLAGAATAPGASTPAPPMSRSLAASLPAIDGGPGRDGDGRDGDRARADGRSGRGPHGPRRPAGHRANPPR